MSRRGQARRRAVVRVSRHQAVGPGRPTVGGAVVAGPHVAVHDLGAVVVGARHHDLVVVRVHRDGRFVLGAPTGAARGRGGIGGPVIPGVAPSGVFGHLGIAARDPRRGDGQGDSESETGHQKKPATSHGQTSFSVTAERRMARLPRERPSQTLPLRLRVVKRGFERDPGLDLPIEEHIAYRPPPRPRTFTRPCSRPSSARRGRPGWPPRRGASALGPASRMPGSSARPASRRPRRSRGAPRPVP